MTLAKHALRAAQDIRDNGTKPLAEHWSDEVGQKAAKDFEQLADQLESAYDILLGGKMLCEAVADSMETALSSAREINELAQRHNLRVGTDGLPEGAPMPGEDPDKLHAREQIVALRDHVLQQVGDSRPATTTTSRRGTPATPPSSPASCRTARSSTPSTATRIATSASTDACPTRKRPKASRRSASSVRIQIGTDPVAETTPRAQERPRDPLRRRRAAFLGVPIFTVAAVTCFVATLVVSTQHVHHQSAACRYIAVPWTHFALAYGGLAAAVLAVAAHIVLLRGARRRGGEPDARWRSSLSTVCVVIAGLMIALTAVVTVMTHADAAETAAHLGKPMCEG
ncbi:hypothetical protein CP973_20935 [Streptomyces albofaciens JCM 4342]|uniref:hypothetical protein n=1 Tax=Streptomyces albofaciens TaxID=66866 RepID=UPI00123B34B5|nr:hypothetical protein [Streptomyces albofaciens]KAA6224042.1 hypothetical protein CP973_20935 [Streptomyces albofaciens JCM 4342]